MKSISCSKLQLQLKIRIKIFEENKTMKEYNVKASYRVSGPGFGMATREGTYKMVLSQFDVNRIREWLAKYYGVGPHDVTVFTCSEVK